MQKQFSVQQLISELAVKRLNVAILPGGARPDKQGLNTAVGEPLLDCFARKFRTVITSNKGRFTSYCKQIPEQFNHIWAFDLSIDIDSQTLSGKFIDHHQQFHQPTVFQPFREKVITPYVVVILGPFTIAGVLTAAYMKLLTLFLAYFKAFLAPKPINSFEVYKPALFSKLYCYSAIAVSRMLDM
jgi:hypothetical protein